MDIRALNGRRSAGDPTSRPQPSREDLLRPLPRIRISTILTVVAVFGIYVWGVQGTRARPEELIAGIPNILDFLSRLFPPQLDIEPYALPIPAFALEWFGGVAPTIPFPTVMFAIIETVQMAIIGTTLAIFLAIPFGLLAARNTTPHPWIYSGTRMLLNINRAIPDIIFALIFVAAVGLGPFGGVLALAIGSIGFMGKLYAEAIEAINPQQVLAIKATGAGRMQSFLYGAVPQALPLAASYSLLLFESNVRSATILGLVGAGGVGFVLNKYLALFQYQKLMGALILIIIAVTLIDRLRAYLRSKII
jgi:phosphonate transport system permease protein